MKFHNPFDSNSLAIILSMLAAAIAFASAIITIAILEPKVILTVIALVLLAGVINLIKYIFTGKGFVQ